MTTMQPRAASLPHARSFPVTATPLDAGTTMRTVRVPLIGKHGKGREMTLDAADWEYVRDNLGTSWSVIPNWGRRQKARLPVRVEGDFHLSGS